jgi:hypothetical protein
MFQLSLDRESAFNKRTFRHYCAKGKNGFVMGPIVSRAPGRRNIWVVKAVSRDR